MTVAWPAALPQFVDSWEEQDDPVALWTNIAGGPPKVRGEVTVPVMRVRTSMVMSASQYSALRDFFRVSLRGGTQDFYFTHPYQHSTQKFWMTAPPTITSDGPLGLRIGMEWMQRDSTSQAAPLDFTVTAQPGNGQVTLTWTPSQFADNYQIYKNDVAWSGLLPNTAYQAIVTGLTNNIAVDLRVMAINGIGERSSNEVNVTPNPQAVPGAFSFSAIAGHRKVVIGLAKSVSWTPPGTLPAVYRIKYGTAPATYTKTIEVSEDATSVILPSLNAQSTYYWRAYAVDTDGVETALAAEANFTAGAAAATYYELRQGAAYPGTLVSTIELGGFPYTDDNLTEGVERRYWLIAKNPAGSTDSAANPQSATPANLLPGAFTFDLEPSVGAITVQLLTTSPRALQYQIRVGDTQPGTLVATVTEAQFPYFDSGLSATPRKYWLAAVNAEGTTYSADNPITATPLPGTKPSAPTFSTTALDSACQINLTGPATYGDTYTLKRGATEGAAATVSSVLTDQSFPYVDTGRTNDVAETYWLYAANGFGSTAASNNPQSCTPVATFTQPPGAFSYTLTPGDSQVSIALSPASVGATYYNIYAGTYGTGTWRQIGGNWTAGQFPVTDTGRTNGTAEKYWLSAFNAGGVTQATGNPKTATPTAGKPGGFSFTATAGAGQVSVALQTPAAAATTYRVTRDGTQIATGVAYPGGFPVVDTGMTNNAAHAYRVYAVNAQGETEADNSPQSATPWSVGLSYPASTRSWDAANAAKMVKFSGTEALQEWRSKDADAVKFDGATSGTACVHTSGTNSVDASASPLRTLYATLALSYPITLSALVWFPSDCPAVCCPIDLGYGIGLLFRKSASNNTVTFTSAVSTVIYLNNNFTNSALENKWHVVTVIISTTTAAVKLRVNGVEVTATPSAAMRAMTGIGINRTTNGIATVGGNVKVKRVAVTPAALSGQALTDFESILLDGEGSGSTPPPPPPGTNITKAHADTHAWVDPRETWAALPAGEYQSQTPGGSYDPSGNTEPGVLAPNGTALMTHVAAPNNANGFAILHRVLSTVPAADGYWRSGFNTGAAGRRLQFGTKYMEAVGFYFPAKTLEANQKELDIYEHHTAYSPNGGMHSGFVMYLRTNNSNPRLDITLRYSPDGTSGSQVTQAVLTVPLQANKWYFFFHKFMHHWDLGKAPYNYIWYAIDGGAITALEKKDVRNAAWTDNPALAHTYAKNELYQYYAWSAGVTERSHYSTGMMIWRDAGGTPTIDQNSAIALLRSIVGVNEANPVAPTLDPWTDPRTRMIVDADHAFSEHSNIEVIAGTSGGYGTSNFAAIPAGGLQVDASARRIITRVQGWPGVDSTKWRFQGQLDETLPQYSTEKTVRVSVGRNQYDADITMDGTSWWYFGEIVIHRSLYEDVYVSGQDGANSYAPYEMTVWGLHHVGDWGGNAAYYDSNNLPPLTPFSVFLRANTNRASCKLFIRLRSSTGVSGDTWTIGSICPTKSQVDNNGTNRDYTLADNLVDGDVLHVVLLWQLGYQKSHNPMMHGWTRKNFGAISGDLIDDTGPLGHYLADLSHQMRAFGWPYVWATAYHGNVFPWTRSANGIILSGNHGYRTGTRGSGAMKNVASSGRPTITAQLLFDYLARP